MKIKKYHWTCLITSVIAVFSAFTFLMPLEKLNAQEDTSDIALRETCVDSDPPNDPCALTNNLCNYPANVVLTECGGVTGGGSGGLGDFTDDVQEYVDTSDNDDGDAVGVIIINPGVGSGNSGGNSGGFSLMAENTLNARNFINTGHSFLNW